MLAVKTLNRELILWLSAILFLILPAKALALTCTAGQIGLLTWRADGATNAVFYCDGFNWLSTDHGATATDCTDTAGTTTYSGGIYQYCGNADGKWHTMKGTNIGTCATAGLTWFNGVDQVFCDGVNIFSMNPNLSCAAKITASGAGTWTVPASFGTPNLIKVIGAGGGSGGSDGTNGGSGGGGGAYNSKTNVTLSSPAKYFIGAGGTAGASGIGSVAGAGGDTYMCSDNDGTAGACDSINGTKVLAGGKGGGGGTYATAGTGGNSALNKPAGGYSGGPGIAQGGAFNPVNTGGGGGGAAGVNGAGLVGSKNIGGTGDNGGTATNTAGSSWGSGAGGANVGPGGGATGGGNNAVGVVGPIYGGGAGGAGKGTRAGAAGGGGLIYITWSSTSGNCN